MIEMISQQLDELPAAQANISALCESLGLPRSTFYRHRDEQTHLVAPEEMELRDAIQSIALEWPAYGYRRITAELDRRGFECNHKRTLRLMRQDNLLCLRAPRSFIKTTDSRHGFATYPNLAAKMILTGINQLWVADITYIRLLREFIYLAVVLDAYSRRAVGWE